MTPLPIDLSIRPLTAETFAPFGEVIEADPSTMRLINGGTTERFHALFSPDFVAEHPEIDWVTVRGMRNRMAHGYFDINLDYVYQTAKHEALDLVRIVDSLIHIYPEGE